jgi:transposase-like protein
MKKISYRGYRFPPEIIQQAIWLYLRFTLSLRDVEDLVAERGIMVSYETVRRWVNHFGPMIAADLRKRRPKPHTTWHLDEVYLKIAGRMVYLWRAVDAEGEVLDVLVQSRLTWSLYCPFFSMTCGRVAILESKGSPSGVR